MSLSKPAPPVRQPVPMPLPPLLLSSSRLTTHLSRPIQQMAALLCVGFHKKPADRVRITAGQSERERIKERTTGCTSSHWTTTTSSSTFTSFFARARTQSVIKSSSYIKWPPRLSKISAAKRGQRSLSPIKLPRIIWPGDRSIDHG